MNPFIPGAVIPISSQVLRPRSPYNGSTFESEKLRLGVAAGEMRGGTHVWEKTRGKNRSEEIRFFTTTRKENFAEGGEGLDRRWHPTRRL